MSELPAVSLLLAATQALLGARVLSRLWSTARGMQIETATVPQPERVSVVLPVLNESGRIEGCLDGLISQSEEVTEILVIDGGSTDNTRFLVQPYTARDRRVRWADASPVPDTWTGKAWGLQVGLQQADPKSEWILCVDADVRAAPALVRSLLNHAKRTGVSALSVATLQRLSTGLEGLLHPSLLTTLVYRFGIPGRATRNPAEVQANGQCFLLRRQVLLRTDALRAAQASLCEDVTIARRIAAAGEAVGFYEADRLVEVTMYSGWREVWDNWPRSLPMRDRYFGKSGALGLLEVVLVQALPLPLLFPAMVMGAPSWFVAVNAFLAALRLGVLAGVSRAYVDRPWTYWLSPVSDLAVACRLVHSALSRRHRWRGRTYVREGKAWKA